LAKDSERDGRGVTIEDELVITPGLTEEKTRILRVKYDHIRVFLGCASSDPAFAFNPATLP
jgi:hypothetical protein